MIKIRRRQYRRTTHYSLLRRIARLMLAAMLTTAAVRAEAGLIFKPAISPNLPCSVSAVWDWTFAPPEVSANGAGPWTVGVSTAAPGGPAFVAVDITHNPGAPVCDAGHGPNPNTIMLTVGPLVQPPALAAPPARMAAGGVVQHGTHFDAGRMTALVLAAAAGQPVGFVSAHALHAGSNLGQVQGSARNPGAGPIDVTITPDYTRRRDATVFDGDPIPLGGLQSGEHKQTPIPGTAEDENGELGFLSSLKASVAGTATSSTHATFLGTVDGVFGELPLDVAIQLFVGRDRELLYPIFGSDATELFIGIDLTQLLSFPPEFSALESFAFNGGLNAAVPGVFVATAEVTLGAAGFESASPFTGEAYVMAIGDARLIPEPHALLLLALGLIGLWYFGRVRTPLPILA